MPLVYTACRTCYSELEPQDIFERATSGRVASERQQDLVRRVIESGHGSTIEHIVFTFAISGVTPHAVPPARAPSGRPRLRPAVAALRRLQGTQLHGARLASATPTTTCGSASSAQLAGSLDVYEEMLAGGHPRRGCPLRDAQRDAHEPRHDDQPAGAHPHVRPAPLHDGPVGDPAALPAHPPRGLHASARSWAPSWRPSACRSATATRTATATSTAPSARTRTPSWRPGPRSKAAARAAGRELPTL